jgi:hypothetical protein
VRVLGVSFACAKERPTTIDKKLKAKAGLTPRIGAQLNKTKPFRLPYPEGMEEQSAVRLAGLVSLYLQWLSRPPDGPD